MCTNCSDFWKTAHWLGPFGIGWGQICEDPSSWLLWLRAWGLYFGFCPARCYWHWEIKNGWTSQGWRFGEGKVKTYYTPRTFSIYAGPFDFSVRI